MLDRVSGSGLGKESGKASGKVCLVGAGPGAADLITLRGLRAIERADVLVYDRLISHELLAYAREDCKLVYAGKRKNLHVMRQDEISDLLVEEALQGRYVVRLKGGDPFVFGRGGEEIDRLIEWGIDWEIVPGVTAASGAAAMLGLPLTHRDESQALTLVTAHRRDGQFNLDWPLVLRAGQTVAFYMALSYAEELVCELLVRGKSPDTPFTVIANSTLATQLSDTCALHEAVEMLQQNNFPSPALLVLGPQPRLGQAPALGDKTGDITAGACNKSSLLAV